MKQSLEEKMNVLLKMAKDSGTGKSAKPSSDALTSRHDSLGKAIRSSKDGATFMSELHTAIRIGKLK